MKKLFSIAIVASAFTFTSCGGGSLAERSANCSCQLLTAAAKVQKQLDTATEEEAREIGEKRKNTPLPACVEITNVEEAKMKADTTAEGKAKYQALQKEINVLLLKKCGEAAKQFMPNLREG
jgi:hypothetical protein